MEVMTHLRDFLVAVGEMQESGGFLGLLGVMGESGGFLMSSAGRIRVMGILAKLGHLFGSILPVRALFWFYESYATVTGLFL